MTARTAGTGFASLALAIVGAIAATTPASAQVRVHCESRNYSYQYCPFDTAADGVALVEQRSRSACTLGVSWGWDRRGLWVDRGCEGVFDVRLAPPPVVAPPPGGGGMLNCASREYQMEFCPLPEGVVQVQLALQRSQAPCIEGRTWGWRANAIWVNGGCDADFQVRSTPVAAPAPAPVPVPAAPGAGLLYCESRDYAYAFCPTGGMRAAQLTSQRSQAPCVLGQTWGYQNDGVWVDRGCAAEFAILR